MEEDIKILEDYIKLINKGYCNECNELCNIYGAPSYPSRAISQAIGNLLKAYKELKEELKKIDEVLNIEEGTAMPSRKCIIESLKGGIALLNKIVDNSIPKSKIKEKIEELREIHKERDFTNKESYYLDCYKELLGEE